MEARFPLIDGSICFDRKKQLAKNISLFLENGKKVYWGDLTKYDLKKLKGLGRFYVLSEHKSYWNVPKEAVFEVGKNPFHNINAARFGLDKLLDTRDKIRLKSQYIKANKIAVIQDGIWISDEKEWLCNYS